MTVEHQPCNSPYQQKTCEVRLHADVPYGVAGVGFSSALTASYRSLKLDVYEPAGGSRTQQRPALILACGGAYSRGDRKNDETPVGGDKNTPISEYCREFARRGFVCFAIDYRLMQEDPHPGFTPTLAPGERINFDRVNYVRAQMGLGPCDEQMMHRTFEAATDDVTQAVQFVRARARAFNVDVSRIALGGFSAGATVALNSAFAEQAPVAAVISLSGRISKEATTRFMTGREDPPVLMIVGRRDLPAQVESVDWAEAHMKAVKHEHQVVRLSDASHFYQRTAVCECDGELTDVETIIATFLCKSLALD
jgi:acetyl esterase/lipase